jgi:hypothetical protein
MVMDRFGTTMLIETDGKEKQYSALNVKVSKNYVQARGDPDFCKTEGFWIEIEGTADDGSKTKVKLLISKQIGLKDFVNKFVEAI